MGLIFDYYSNPAEYPEWLIEDIQDTIEELGLTSDMTPEELEKMANKLWQEGQWLYDDAIRKENNASTLERIARDLKEHGVKWIK